MICVLLHLSCSSVSHDTESSILLAEPELSKVSGEALARIQAAFAEARANPEDAAAVGEAAMILHAYEQRKAAERLYARAAELQMEDFRWPYLHGVVLSELGLSDRAIESFRAAQRIEPSNPLASLRLGDELLRGGCAEEAFAIFERLAQEPPDLVAAQYGLGRALAEMGRYAEGSTRLERAAALLKDYGPLHYRLAMTYRLLKRDDEAESHMAAYQRLGPSRRPLFQDPFTEQVEELNKGSYLYHLNRGRRMEAAGRLRDAAEELLRAAEVEPSLPQAHVNLISVYGKLGEFERGEQHYRRAIAINPHLEEAYYNFGVLCSLQQRYQQAAEAYRQALRINPLSADSHLNLGDSLEHLKQREQAEHHYRTALENRPSFRLAHFRLGLSLFSRGRKSEGIEHLRETVAVEDEQTPQFLVALARACRAVDDRKHALEYAASARRLAKRYGKVAVLELLDREFPTQK